MPRGGNNRKPTEAKVLQMTSRKDRDAAAAPEAPKDSRDKFPSCPAWLSDDAKAEWARLAPKMKGTVTVKHRSAFAAYCDAFGRWKGATAGLGIELKDCAGKIVAESWATTYILPNGCPAVRPEMKIIAQALKEMKLFGEACGLTPYSEGRMGKPAPGKPAANPWDDL